MAKKSVEKKTPEAFDVNDLLRSWASLQVGISKLSLEQVAAALKHELKNKRRQTIISRLSTRYITESKPRYHAELIERLSAE